jgi:drug/metabolite transporter (DMT)-like permease
MRHPARIGFGSARRGLRLPRGALSHAQLSNWTSRCCKRAACRGTFWSQPPLAKLLLTKIEPWLLAALLYLGSGLGLYIARIVMRSKTPTLSRADWRWMLLAVLLGGIVAPVLLVFGLQGMTGSGASLLLNAEAVLTAVIAWVVFKENVDRRVAFGLVCIVAGGVVLGWGETGGGNWLSALAIVGACLGWGFDNNFTRKVALNDASFIAMVKGLVAGTTNLVIALALGAALPPVSAVGSAALLGFTCYGVSLVLFIVGMRHLGTARAGAYFAVAPFLGATLSVLLLGEPITASLIAAGALMVVGVWLHLSEQHGHPHEHEALSHTHSHAHGTEDDHHDHAHGEPLILGKRHSHPHYHRAQTHSHPHVPDAHHAHTH